MDMHLLLQHTDELNQHPITESGPLSYSCMHNSADVLHIIIYMYQIKLHKALQGAYRGVENF